jgi:hypothetical protein
LISDTPDMAFSHTKPLEAGGDKNKPSASPCMSYEPTKWGNLFAVGCDPGEVGEDDPGG